MDKTDRSFTITGKSGGRYISKTPAGAAKKAFTQKCKKSNKKGVCSFDITLKETTQGSKNKTYKYKIKRTKLKTPLKVKLGKNDVIIKFKVSSKSMK